MSQIVRSRAVQTPVEQTQVALVASASIIERSALELINEAKKNWAQGNKQSDDVSTLAKKLLLEFRQIGNAIEKETPPTNFTKAEQSSQLKQYVEDLSLLLEQLSSTTFTTDLDKALIIQIKLISKKIEEISDLTSVEPATLLTAIQTIAESLKKIRVGIQSIITKSRDFSLNRKLRIWAESILAFTFVIRLSAAAHLLDIPLAKELQLSVRFKNVVAVNKEFYEQLAQLRGG